jgi:hypothetical protein
MSPQFVTVPFATPLYSQSRQGEKKREKMRKRGGERERESRKEYIRTGVKALNFNPVHV